jgi:hypothetical protein
VKNIADPTPVTMTSASASAAAPRLPRHPLRDREPRRGCPTPTS